MLQIYELDFICLQLKYLNTFFALFPFIIALNLTIPVFFAETLSLYTKCR
ncbi:hypothetical protein K450DRAFT_247844 [Umbelopsis ramanniana AG]|uniref:Uncharacterized protein n=1 Tax=Umbelopsis ramanniana AG TaxID=1314678 RepID=A0AAD5E6C8_UMBRA|nr:uncharacterized protein K450DRAFT_247844 [Umbelopsis ramanniana AG]KAI8578226.1 hypothetical protein K450DRAFT_247844 [Umbelopsis ramanniana AG]